MLFRITFVVVFLVGIVIVPAQAEDLPVVVIEKLPVGRLIFVTGKSFGSAGTISSVGQHITPFEGNEPEVVPDANAIIFANRKNTKSTIFFRELADNSTTEIDADGQDAGSPSLSRGDHKLVFVAWPPGRKMSHIYLDDGNKFISLTTGEHYNWTPRWSPDGKKIVFETTRDGQRQIYVMDADGENQTNLTNSKKLCHAPSWSPDGNHIAYMSISDSKQCNIFVMKNDGSDKQNVSNGSTRDSEPTWSPDGEWIAFTRTRANPPERETMDIWIMKRDGTEQQPVTHNTDDLSSYRPTWAN